MLRGVPTTRTILVPGSTGLEEIQQPIVVYDLELHEVGGEFYQIAAIHISGGLGHIGEFVVKKDGTELENLRVDFDSTGTVSEADENGEVTTFTPKDAMAVLRSIPFEIDNTKRAQREAGFLVNLGTVNLSTEG